MKKTLIILLLVVALIAGIILSDFVVNGINQLLNTEFPTRKGLNKKLEEAEKKIQTAEEKYKKLAMQVSNKKTELDNLNREINTGVNDAKIKEMLLTNPSSSGSGVKGNVLLGPSSTESILKPLTSDDESINQLKDTINKKTAQILDVSKGILREKVGQLNNELIRINDQLKDRNVQLIGKLREVDKYKKALEDQKKYINDLEGLKGDLEKTVGVLETKIENGRLKVSFQGDILFDSGRHRLRKEGEDLLKKVHSILMKSIEKNDIFIAGHTDNVPIREVAREKYKSNWDLSTYRAIEVVKYLVGKGMAPEHLTAAGYGEYKPITSNSTTEGKAKNRRVELFIIPRIIKRN